MISVSLVVVDVLSSNGDIFGKLCGSRVTRCTVELLELGILLYLPFEGMFPATGTDDKYFQCNRVVLSASFHKYGDVCGQRDGVEFAKGRRRDVSVHHGGGATKKLMPSRRHPSGCWRLRVISVSLVVADVPASPSPRSLISPRKPHQQT